MGAKQSIERVALALAQDRGQVTAADLVADHDVDEAEAKRVLALLHQRRELELDLEGDDFVYRLRGEARAAPQPAPKAAAKPAPKPKPKPAPKPKPKPKPKPEEPKEPNSEKEPSEGASQALMRRGKEALRDVALSAVVDRGKKDEAPSDEDKKSLLWGVGLGFFLPGAGLFYAAPWITAVFTTVVVVAAISILQLIPFFGAILTYMLFGAFMLTSGVLGGLYTHQFNKRGKRTRLLKDRGPKLLPL